MSADQTRWEHNDAERRWELIADRFIFGGKDPEQEVLVYVTDEFLRDAILPRSLYPTISERDYLRLRQAVATRTAVDEWLLTHPDVQAHDDDPHMGTGDPLPDQFDFTLDEVRDLATYVALRVSEVSP